MGSFLGLSWMFPGCFLMVLSCFLGTVYPKDYQLPLSHPSFLFIQLYPDDAYNNGDHTECKKIFHAVFFLKIQKSYHLLNSLKKVFLSIPKYLKICFTMNSGTGSVSTPGGFSAASHNRPATGWPIQSLWHQPPYIFIRIKLIFNYIFIDIKFVFTPGLHP